VFANWDEYIFKCNCCKFERDGLLCYHIIKVMTHVRIYQVPEAYILKRWTWDAEAALGVTDRENHPNQREMPEEARSLMVFASMRDEFIKIAKVACKTNDGRRIVRTHLKSAKQELDVITRRDEKKAREAEEAAITMPSSNAPNANVPPATSTQHPMQHPTYDRPTAPTTSNSGSHVSSTQNIQNPPISSTRGRPQEIANKAPLNLATKKPRRCSYYNSTDHNIRKCPEKLKLMGYKP
jgi:hypothetical protein